MYSQNNVDLQHKKKMSKIKISDKTLNKVAFVLRLQIEYILLLLCVCPAHHHNFTTKMCKS